VEKDHKDPLELFQRSKELLQILQQSEEFTKEVLKENAKLRYRLAQLEEESKKSAAGVDEEKQKLLELLSQIEEEKKGLLQRFTQVEEENQNFAQRYVQIEEQNNNLANLYVAGFQLHSTLDFKEVLEVVKEILINLVGTEELSVMLLDEATQELTVVASEGAVDPNLRVKVGEGLIGEAAAGGESYLCPDVATAEKSAQGQPLACIPMKIKDELIGVIVVYKLLFTKKDFTNVDYELFTLLAGQAATAIFSARLYSQTERKLTTIKSFIDLLKAP
jgi:GAF domain-containing protein